MTEEQRRQFQEVSRMLIAGFSLGVPKEGDLRTRLDIFRPFAESLSDRHFDEIFDEVSKVLSINMELGFVVEAKDHKPWLAERRANIDWKLWNAYTHVQTASGKPALLIDRMGQSLDVILDHMGDPEQLSPWARLGLVIGDVQSGKTGTYIGLMDKAADAGYKVFIVLTGNTESLRQQTQSRIDSGFIGSDSMFVARAHAVEDDASKRVGVGKYLESVASTVSLTTMTSDFKKATALGVNIDAAADRIIVFITKKNKTVLGRIEEWLNHQDKVEGKIQLPLLLIDDESDYASVNTKNADEEPTAINAAIRKILGLFHRSSYVGFTATPFANIFIDDEHDRDLFPRNFIYGLEAPTNYVGPQSLFGFDRDAVDGDPIHILEDAEEFFPIKHKSLFPIEGIPESLRTAMRIFLLANAIRDLRGQATEPRAMLVNVSRYNNAQKQVSKLVEDTLAEYRNALQLHARAYAEGDDNAVVRSFENSFYDEYFEAGVDWADVLNILSASSSQVEVRLVNSKADKKLEQDELSTRAPERVIAVGGDLLSRGLTLDGLVVSYFYRHTAASDTLMQMGRWFGYRTGYGDLCRIWIAPEMSAAFAYAADSLEELRYELKRMQSLGKTPEQYGLAVKNHPGALLITARNKSRATTVGKKTISLRGRSIETYKLSIDLGVAETNVKAAETLVTRLTASYGIPTHARPSRPIWREVDKGFVADFLADYIPHENLPLFQRRALAQFVRRVAAEDLQTWDVVFVGGSGTSRTFSGVELNQPMRAFERGNGDEESWLVSGTKQRVAGRGDVASAMPLSRYKEIEDRYLAEKADRKSAPDSEFTYELERPILLVYPIQATADAETLPGTYVAIKLALPGNKVDNDNDNDNDNDEDEVTYILNAVAQKQWFPEYVDTSSEDDDDV